MMLPNTKDTLQMKRLICYMEEEKFAPEVYREQMEHVRRLAQTFEQVFYLQQENAEELFALGDARQSLCLTTSPEVAGQMQGLGIAVVGFSADTQELMQAPYVVLGLEEVTHEDLLRVYQRWHHLPWKILETKRCLVREFAMEDLDALFELYDQPHLSDYIEPLYPYEQEMQYEQNYIQHVYGFYGFGMWLVFDKNTGQLIGRAGVEHREPCGEAEVELGYVICPERWRQGYATEVCRAIIAYARERLCMERVLCRVHRDNEPSICFLTKLGFEKVSDGEEWIFSYTL